MSWTIPAAFVAWFPATMILFRAIGPRRASLISLLAGFLLLPRELYPLIHLGPFTVNKRVVSGLALLAGVVVSDPRALLRARPGWLDAPMIAFVLLPLASLAANGLADPWVAIDQVVGNFAEWSLPYLVGRLYFADREGPRRIAVGVAVAAMASLPPFAFEMVMGPRWYLAGLVYGIAPHENMVVRLGGWRPEGFLTNGIEVSAWLSLSAVLAAWIWLRRARLPRGLPAWGPAFALSIAAIASRSVYGYANLAVGMGSVAIAHFFRTRLALIALAIVPPAYVAARISGAWDGAGLVRLASMTGRPDTVAYRLHAENSYLQKVASHGIVLGFGGSESGIYEYWARAHLWPDGWWIHRLRSGGVVGLATFWLAAFLIPAGLGIALPAGKRGGASPGAMARGLSLFLLLHALDSLHNMDLLGPSPLIGGSLVGLFMIRRSARPDVEDEASPASGIRSGISAALAATVLVLAVVEMIGRSALPPISPSIRVPLPGPPGENRLVVPESPSRQR